MSYLVILRPGNFIFVSVCVLFGALFKNNAPFNYKILYAMSSASAIAGAGYIINDFFDLPIDTVNRPGRIIPSGKISPRTAYLYSVCMFLMGIVLSYLTANFYCVLLAIFNSLILFYYAKTYKKKLLVGNVIVSFSAASCFIYGALCTGNLNNSIMIGVFAFLFTLIREIVKDAEDMEGDSKFGVKSVAILFGKRTVLRFAWILVIIITSLFLYSFSQRFFSLITVLLSVLFVVLPLIFILLYLNANIDSKKAFSKSSTLLKINMLVLLIIVLIGS